MIPDPLHPAIVHFPIVLMFVAPLVAGWAIWRMRMPESGARVWLVVPVLLAAVAVSSFVAVRTGEDGEDFAEQFVDHDTVEEHEEQGTQFMWFALASVVIAAAGFLPGRAGLGMRILTLVVVVTGVVLVTRTGHSGGTMVYEQMVGDGPASTEIVSGEVREDLREDEDARDD